MTAENLQERGRARLPVELGCPRMQSGLSLIELMVALTLSLILLGLVIQVFASQRQTFAAGQALARVQENNRFVAELVREPARALALQGFCGGNARYRNHINLVDANQTVFDPRRMVGGWEYAGTGRGASFAVPGNLAPNPANAGQWTGGAEPEAAMGALPAQIANRVVPFSDVLLVRELRPVFNNPGSNSVWPQAGSLELDEESFDTNLAHGLGQCATVLMTNCVRADVFVNTANAATNLARDNTGCTPANRTGTRWQFFYEDDAHLYHVVAHAFFVGLNTITQEPGFFRVSFDGRANPPAEELVSGVETLQILYGYGAPSPRGDGQQVDVWMTAAEVPNWELVMAIRLDAIVRSDASVGTGAVAVQFEIGEGNTVTMPSDRLLRQPVTATMSLRNRMITQ